MIHNDPIDLNLFLNYIATQPVYSERALEAHEARVELLERFTRYLGRAYGRSEGDEALAEQPAEANAPPCRRSCPAFPRYRRHYSMRLWAQTTAL